MKTIVHILIVILFTLTSVVPVSAQHYLIPAKKNGFWGYMNRQGKWIVPASFTEVSPFTQGLAGVKYGGYWGYIDRSGEWIIDPVYTKAKPFSDHLAAVKTSGKWGFIDERGVWHIEPMYMAVSSFSEGMAVVYQQAGFKYVDKSGATLIDKKFTYAKPFAEGLASVIIDNEKGYIDYSGRFMIRHQYDKADSFSEGLALVAQHGKYGFINHRGDIIIPLMFRDANRFSEGRASVKVGDRWGFIDKTGEICIAADYEYVGNFKFGMAVARYYGKYGMIDENGSWIIKPEYDDLWEMGRTLSLEQEVTKIVEQRIRKWERKGEFEKTADYLVRINNDNREEEVNKQIKIAINELATNRVDLRFAELGLYNADAEVFTLYVPRMISSLVPVPLEDAIWFKDNWDRAEILDPEFSIHDDRFVLTRFIVNLDERKYYYDAYEHGVYASNFQGTPHIGNIEITLPELPVPLENGSRQMAMTGNISEVDKNIPVNDIVQNHIFALVIGNEDYDSYQVGNESSINVDFAENDARIFNEYMIKTLGIPEENITLLINATAGQINQALAKMTALAKAHEGQAEFIFYYAGHGLPDEKTQEPYLVPVDVSASDLSYAIALAEVYEKFTDYQAGKVTMFIDACFSGGARNEPLLASRGIRIRPKSPFVMGNLVVFSAARGDQTAYVYKDEYHGMFTYHLLKILQESRGRASFGTMAKYLEKEVNIRSLLINNREQQPTIKVSPILEYTWRDFTFFTTMSVQNE